MDYVIDFFNSFKQYLILSSPYLLLGLLLAGIIHTFISNELITKHLGGKNPLSFIKASLFGIPMPLCSCSVIPMAAMLKKNGASNASTSSFLISTPETGVDSISVTYALIDLPMTIFRPVAAFLTSIFAGVLQHIFNKEDYLEEIKTEEKGEKKDHCCESEKSSKKTNRPSLFQLIKKSLRYAFIDLIDDMSLWILFGLIMGALMDIIIPNDFFENLSPATARLAIIVVAIPLYICASATTPLAVTLIAKGLSPGTALLLLLLGPATKYF